MRSWTLHPNLMDQQHLLGEHVEHHMLIGSLLNALPYENDYNERGLFCMDAITIRLRHDHLAQRLRNHESPIDYHLKTGHMDRNTYHGLFAPHETSASQLNSYIVDAELLWRSRETRQKVCLALAGLARTNGVHPPSEPALTGLDAMYGLKLSPVEFEIRDGRLYISREHMYGRCLNQPRRLDNAEASRIQAYELDPWR